MSSGRQIQFTVFNKTTGVVECVIGCSERDAQFYTQPPGRIIIGGNYDGELWYLDPETEKPVEKAIFAGFDQDDVAAGTVVTGLVPPGTMVVVNEGEPVLVDDGTVEFEPEHAGVFRIKLFGLKIKTWMGVVHAH